MAHSAGQQPVTPPSTGQAFQQWQTRGIVIVVLLISIGITIFLWWQKVPWYFIIIPPIALGLILLGYSHNLSTLTGFVEDVEDTVTGKTRRKPKTLWDWLSVLIIPLVLALSVAWFSGQQSAQQAAQQAVANSAQARNQQQETTFQAYLDRMSDLIQNGKLADPHSSLAIRALARSQTLATLRRSDTMRKGYVVEFLHDVGLIAQPNPIVNLSLVDLRGVNLHSAYLSDVDLSLVFLSGADLSIAVLLDADLHGAILDDAVLLNTYLRGADLHGAILCGSNLRGAVLVGAKLPDADLSGADLSGAYLSGADLSGVDLSGATVLCSSNLHGAVLVGAHLRNANLSGANLRGVNLSGADLSGATVTMEQLASAFSLAGTTMPDGSKHP